MKLELLRNADNKVVGYKMIKESSDDTAIFEQIRDMYFWNMDDQVLDYDGRTTNDEGYTTTLKFATKEHKKIEIDKINNIK